MAYGLKVYNGDSQTLIDSNDTASSLVKTASGTVSGTNFGYPTGVVLGDLFLVRLASSGFVAENLFSSGTRTIYSSVSGGKPWIKAEVMSGNVSSHDSGYGLNVFTSAGTAAANLLFSSVPADSLDVVTVGSYGDLTGTSLEVSINSTSPHYVLIPGSFYFHYPGGSWPATQPITIKKGYSFTYSGSTLTKISVDTYGNAGGGNFPLSYGNQSYMIVRYRSD